VCELSDVVAGQVLHRVPTVLKRKLQLALNVLEVPPLASNPNAKQMWPIQNDLNDLPECKQLKNADGDLTVQEKI
jgi:hypothetical protein